MVLVLENRWTSISYDLSFITAMTDRDWFEYEYCFAEYEYRVAEYDTNRRNQPQSILLAPRSTASECNATGACYKVVLLNCLGSPSPAGGSKGRGG